MHIYSLHKIILFANKKIANHNMAGGFDGMVVTNGAPERATTQLKGWCDGSYF